jgi:hypothetical protein
VKWFKEAACDNDTGLASTTRFAVLISSVTLCFSTVLLTLGVLWKPELVPALSVVAGGLATMSGGSYMAQRAWNPRRNQRVDNPDE